MNFSGQSYCAWSGVFIFIYIYIYIYSSVSQVIINLCYKMQLTDGKKIFPNFGGLLLYVTTQDLHWLSLWVSLIIAIWGINANFFYTITCFLPNQNEWSLTKLDKCAYFCKQSIQSHSPLSLQSTFDFRSLKPVPKSYQNGLLLLDNYLTAPNIERNKTQSKHKQLSYQLASVLKSWMV